MRQGRLVLAISVSVVAIAAVGLAAFKAWWGSSGAVESRISSAGTDSDPAMPVMKGYTPVHSNVGGVVQALTVETAPILSSIVGAGNTESATRAVSDTLTAYLSADRAGFESVLEAMGISPPESQAVGMWDRLSRAVRDAEVDITHVRVRREAGAPLTAGGSMHTSFRDAGRPESVRERANADSLEVLIPMRMRDIQDQVFAATVGIEFVRVPGTQRWILRATRLYDAPPGIAPLMFPV